MKISKVSDQAHKRLSVLLWGDPKIGKTYLSGTLDLEDDSKLLYVGIDPGQLAIRDRDFVALHPENGKLNQGFFDEVLQYVREHATDYDWIYIDGVDELADAILKEKMSVQKNGLKAYGEMAEYVEYWLKSMRDIEGVSTVFTTHIDRRDNGEGGIEFIPLFPGKQIQTQVNGWFDLIGCMRWVKDVDGKTIRVIQFNQEVDPKYLVGDRSGALNAYEEPNLGNIFKKIHEAGFVTKGNFNPKIPVSDKDLVELAALAASVKVDPSDVTEYCVKTFEVSPRGTTKDQLEQVKKWLRTKGD